MDLQSKIILIAGPTASGKSNFAIKLAKKIHGDRYDYPTHRWNKNLASTDIVEIICKIHGSFFMKLSDHKRGYNCPQCAREEGYRKRRATSLKKSPVAAVLKSRMKPCMFSVDWLSCVSITRRSLQT